MYVAGVFTMAYLLAPFNFAALGYLIFGFFMVAYMVPIRQGVKVIFGSIAAFVVEMWLLGADTGGILSALVPSLTLAVIAVFTAYAHQHQLQLRRSQDEILRLATLAERERIGRDLHDLLGHTLSVVALKSELARKLIDRDIDAARREIAEVERVARDSLSQVRNAVSGIRSTALSSELMAATALLEAQGLKVKCETENVKLPADRETVLALSLREAATNVRRHSGASVVTIRVRKEAAVVVVEVADDGKGGRIVPGNGLNGMRERLDTVGGSLSLWPNPSGGTLLRASVPLAA
jgi:two-component system sensor histidine kinase DesK